MPWGDRTGPAGLGPRTGRGLGYCNGYDQPGYVTSPGFGRGYGRGFGFGRGAWGRRGAGFGYGWGRGWGAWNWPVPATTPTSNKQSTASEANERELTDMKNELHSLKSTVEGLLNRLNALTSRQEESRDDE